MNLALGFLFLQFAVGALHTHRVDSSVARDFRSALVSGNLRPQGLPMPRIRTNATFPRPLGNLDLLSTVQETSAVPVDSYSSSPYSYEGKLYFKVGTLKWSSCSATVVDENIIITAGHCVESGGPFGQIYKDFFFVPQYREDVRTGKKMRPLGYYGAVESAVHSRWSNEGEVSRDIALLRLSGDLTTRTSSSISVGSRLGGVWAVLPSASSSSNCMSMGNTVTMLGYPAKPSPQFDGKSMVRTFTTIRATTTWYGRPPMYVYTSDQRQGCSGGGVFVNPHHICTVNSSGGSDSSGFEFVVGPMIDSEVLDLKRKLLLSKK